MNTATQISSILQKAAESFDPSQYDLREVFQGENDTKGFISANSEECLDVTFEARIGALSDGDTFIIGFIEISELFFWTAEGEEGETLFTSSELEEEITSKNFNL